MLFLFLCTRQESNLYYQLRKLTSYPLNDECVIKNPFRDFLTIKYYLTKVKV